MTVQLSTAVRNAQLDSVESTTGTLALLRILTGAQPADCATAESGTELIEIALPSDWMAAASGGTKAEAGTWSGTATGDGTAGYFRILDTAGTTCHMQGSVSTTGADMNLDNTSILTGQTVTISGFTLTGGNP